MGLVQDRRRFDGDTLETETQTSLDLKGLSVEEVQALVDAEVGEEPSETADESFPQPSGGGWWKTSDDESFRDEDEARAHQAEIDGEG